MDEETSKILTSMYFYRRPVMPSTRMVLKIRHEDEPSTKILTLIYSYKRPAVSSVRIVSKTKTC
jgi:hypothetical protein